MCCFKRRQQGREALAKELAGNIIQLGAWARLQTDGKWTVEINMVKPFSATGTVESLE